jgi:hypothetical protein
MAVPRTLTVICRSGLANRLRVLVTGLALAEASGRNFRMVWPRNQVCAAAFGELFVGDWPVTDIDVFDRAWEACRIADWPSERPPVPVDDPRPEIVILVNAWLLSPNAAATPRALVARYAALLARLEPLPTLAERIAEFRTRHFRRVMIGVHLRRGDFLRHRPDVVGNTAAALAAVDGFLARVPNAGILLCTDDGAVDPDTGLVSREGVAECFRARLGDRVVSTAPRSLDRRTVEGIQDALVDLQLLRATQMLVGTDGSSFSRLAVFGRQVPHVLVGGRTSGDVLIGRLARLTGVLWLGRRLLDALGGYDERIPKSWNQLIALVRRLVKKYWMGGAARSAARRPR